MFTDDDDKLVECGRCESWEKHYELLNDAILGAKLHWYCRKCNGLAISAVKTDKDIEEKYCQYFETVRQEINETRLVIDKRITDEVT